MNLTMDGIKASMPVGSWAVVFKDEDEIDGVSVGPVYWRVPDGLIPVYPQPVFPTEPGWMDLPSVVRISRHCGLVLEHQ